MFYGCKLFLIVVPNPTLSALNQILKKICDHPLLLTKKAAEGVLEGMDTMLDREELGMVEEMAMNLANMTDHGDAPQVDLDVSCKISFILSLLVRTFIFIYDNFNANLFLGKIISSVILIWQENLIQEGHVVLVFSQTRKMLNLIQVLVFLSTCFLFLCLLVHVMLNIH